MVQMGNGIIDIEITRDVGSKIEKKKDKMKERYNMHLLGKRRQIGLI